MDKQEETNEHFCVSPTSVIAEAMAPSRREFSLSPSPAKGREVKGGRGREGEERREEREISPAKRVW